jgi:hypothetical protein
MRLFLLVALLTCSLPVHAAPSTHVNVSCEVVDHATVTTRATQPDEDAGPIATVSISPGGGAPGIQMRGSDSPARTASVVTEGGVTVVAIDF